jgi:hypothetical protein
VRQFVSQATFEGEKTGFTAEGAERAEKNEKKELFLPTLFFW